MSAVAAGLVTEGLLDVCQTTHSGWESARYRHLWRGGPRCVTLTPVRGGNGASSPDQGKIMRKTIAGIGGAAVLVMTMASPASAYEAEAGNASCSSVHGTVTTKGTSSPGSIQWHTHDGGITKFGAVYGVYYTKYANRGEVSAAYYIEARNNGGAIGYLDNAKTYGYCVY